MKTALMRTERQTAISREGKMRGRWKEQAVLQSMVIPGLVFLVIFGYIPLIGLVIAFQDIALFLGAANSPWVGLKHFIAFFTSDSFWTLMKNTLGISFLKLIFGFPAPIILALLFNEIRQEKTKRVFQTETYQPHFISWVVVAGMLTSMLAVDGGTINSILTALHLTDEPINFLSEPKYFWTILVSANIWKTVGFNAIIFIAAIAGINPELYEAASVDGASRLRQMFIVTLPCIVPQIMIMLIMNIAQILNAGFEDILLLTYNGDISILLEVGDVIDTYVYRYGVKLQRYSYGTAVGLFKSIVSISMLFAANYVSKRLTESSLW